ncbi:MAG: hypothetical protein JXQ26_01350 [Tissierellales bacterium]|nr:hypothetical protein [Tissierellales bacterium]MBN2826602.1 hypothetical protein [Tissierellales bacterium]
MIANNATKLTNKLIAVMLLIVIAVGSFLFVSKEVTKPEFNRTTIESLEEKEEIVMRLTLAAFLNAIAILIVTSCVIPIVVILIFVGIIKIFFGFEIKTNRLIPIKSNKIADSGRDY